MCLLWVGCSLLEYVLLVAVLEVSSLCHMSKIIMVCKLKLSQHTNKICLHRSFQFNAYLLVCIKKLVELSYTHTNNNNNNNYYYYYYYQHIPLGFTSIHKHIRHVKLLQIQYTHVFDLNLISSLFYIQFLCKPVLQCFLSTTKCSINTEKCLEYDKSLFFWGHRR